MQPQDFWQAFDAPAPATTHYTDAYPAAFDATSTLHLPIRVLADGERALASLIINQASFTVLDALAAALAQQLAPFRPDIIVGLPTLGLTLAAAVAQKLGHTRYLPLGTSAKFWYREDLSVPLTSITTPAAGKRLYIDPRMLPLLENRRVALVDDVISSGVSMAAGLALLASCNATPTVLGAAMLQSDAWRARLGQWQNKIASVLQTPILRRSGEGWQA